MQRTFQLQLSGSSCLTSACCSISTPIPCWKHSPALADQSLGPRTLTLPPPVPHNKKPLISQRRISAHRNRSLLIAGDSDGTPPNQYGSTLYAEVSLSGPLLAAKDRSKLDAGPDQRFYERPRFLTHAEDLFLEKVTALYKESLRPQSRVLDLMSSWVSHLPEDLELAHVEGHGMNEAELAANKRLDHHFKQDLNERQELPFPDASFDAVINCLSIQYLQEPEKVLEEVFRVLAPGGTLIISFSKHSYREKAIAGWLRRSMEERLALVTALVQKAGFTSLDVYPATAPPPLDDNITPLGDPFYAVVAKKAPKAVARVALKEDDANYQSFAAKTLSQLSAKSRSDGKETPAVLEQWIAAYQVMAEEAKELGIPEQAIPKIGEPVSAEGLRAATDHLRGIIESYMSSGL